MTSRSCSPSAPINPLLTQPQSQQYNRPNLKPCQQRRKLRAPCPGLKKSRHRSRNPAFIPPQCSPLPNFHSLTCSRSSTSPTSLRRSHSPVSTSAFSSAAYRCFFTNPAPARGPPLKSPLKPWVLIPHSSATSPPVLKKASPSKTPA